MSSPGLPESPTIRYRPIPRAKTLIGRGLDAIGLTRAGHALTRWKNLPFVRALNCHETLAANAPQFEAQLRYWAQFYRGVEYDDLVALCSGNWPHERPGLILSFDDGWRCQAEVAAPLLEKYGFTGWFFIPVGFVETPTAEFVLRQPRGRDLVPMNWDELRLLARRHVIGSHTYTHHTLPEETSAQTLGYEIRESKCALEAGLEQKVNVFCWVRGLERDYRREVAEAIEAAGYTHSFLTTAGVIRPGSDSRMLPRTNVEARHPMWLARYQVCGLPDLLGGARRRRIELKLRGKGG